MASKTALTVTVRVDGLKETLRAFRGTPKAVTASLRQRTLELSRVLATRAADAARIEGGPAALMAPTVKPVRDRVPAVQAGGTRRVGRNRVPAWAVLFGGEFGMNQRSGWYAKPQYNLSVSTQFKPHRGRRGYWFFPVVEANQAEIGQAWLRIADDVLDEFRRGGEG